MTYQLNEKLRGFQPYTPVQEDPDIIHLDANECGINLPQSLLEQAAAEIPQISFNRYPDAYAADLCEAFAGFYGINPAHVTAGNGSDELIGLLVSAFLMKGETMLTTDPDFSMYTFYPLLAETPYVLVNKGDSFEISADSLIEQAKACKARLVLFSNPCNPTSIGLPKEEVVRILRGLPDTLVVVDEAYMDFWEPAQSLLGDEDAYDNIVILKTCSKMGLAALRLGFAVANPRLTGVLHVVKSVYNVNTMTQRVAAVVLREKETLRRQIKETIQSRDYLQAQLQNLLDAHPGAFRLYPSAANFVTICTPNAADLHAFLMKRKVSVRKFPGMLRITAGTVQEDDAFLASLRAFLEESK